MPKLLLCCALTLAALSGMLGCAGKSGTVPLGGGPPNGIQQHPLAAAKKPGLMARTTALLTDNPVSRGVSSAVKKGTGWLKPDPKPTEVPDRISLANKAPAPTPDWHVAMAGVQEKLGKQKLAVSQYEEALKLDPRHLGALLGLAHHHDRHGRMEQATKVYQKAAKYHPKNTSVLNDMGLCYARRGNYEASLKALEQAVELNPRRKLYRNNLAKVLIQVGRKDQALQHLVAAHGQAVGHYNMGYLLSLRGDNQAAAQQFQLALQVDPSLEPARTWLAQHAPQGNAMMVAQRRMIPPSAGAQPSAPPATSLRLPPVGPASQSYDRYAAPQPAASAQPTVSRPPPSTDRYRTLQTPDVGASARFVSPQETPPTPSTPQRYDASYRLEPSADQQPEATWRF